MIAGSLSNGQPELAQPCPAVARGRSSVAAVTAGIRRAACAPLPRASASTLAPPPTTPRPPPRMVIGHAVRPDRSSSRSFAALHCRRSTCAASARAAPIPGQLLLDERGEREIEVVAAEQQVFADRDPLERRARRPRHSDPDQAEVGGAAADVADQDERTLAERRPSAVADARRSTRRTRPAAPRAGSGATARRRAPLRRSARAPPRRTTRARSARSAAVRTASARIVAAALVVPGVAQVCIRTARRGLDRRKSAAGFVAPRQECRATDRRRRWTATIWRRRSASPAPARRDRAQACRRRHPARHSTAARPCRRSLRRGREVQERRQCRRTADSPGAGN